MHRLLPLVLVATLGAASVGCRDGADSTPSTDTEPLTSAELGWIRAYSVWTFEIYDDELGPSTGARLVRACRHRLDELGPTPSKRLQGAADLAGSVCPLLAHRGMRRRALDAIESVDSLLLPLLRDEQPLQLRTGVTDRSRADTVLSAFATNVVDRPVEVRCWSAEDWRRVVGEDNAWNDASKDFEELYGWADDGADRIHMRLGQCNKISRLEGEDVRARSRRDRIEAADSLGTLAHEIQHFLLPDADEAKIECASLLSLPDVGQRLGLDRASAIALAELYRTEIYPDLPSEYRAGGCPRQA